MDVAIFLLLLFIMNLGSYFLGCSAGYNVAKGEIRGEK